MILPVVHLGLTLTFSVFVLHVDEAIRYLQQSSSKIAIVGTCPALQTRVMVP